MKSRVEENREELEFLADTDLPAAEIAETLLELAETEGGIQHD